MAALAEMWAMQGRQSMWYAAGIGMASRLVQWNGRLQALVQTDKGAAEGCFVVLRNAKPPSA